MDQLSAIDAAFLYAESRRMPMHVTALTLYDPAAAPGGRVAPAEVAETICRRAPRIDCFHRKLVEVPFTLDHPYWIEDAAFDPAQHVHCVELAAPGDWHTLCELAAELHAKPIERGRPLWEIYVISGLQAVEPTPGEGFAVLTKIHHAAVDGVAGVGVTAALHDLEPTPTATGADGPLPANEQPASEQPASEQAPNNSELVGRALFHGVERATRAARVWPQATRVMPTPVAPPPQTRFNGSVFENRIFDAACLQLGAVRSVKDTVPGATVNDVVLTIVGGALRSYLLAKNHLPRRSMTAMVPVNRRALTDVGQGNRVSALIATLGTDMADPLARLEAVQRSTAEAKRANARQDSDLVETLAEVPPAPAAAFAAYGWSHLPANPLFNTVVTNVAGPRVPFYLCGAELVRGYATGPLMDGLGLFHTALGYRDELTLSITSCPELMPDPDVYVEAMQEAFAELCEAAGVHHGARADTA